MVPAWAAVCPTLLQNLKSGARTVFPAIVRVCIFPLYQWWRNKSLEETRNWFPLNNQVTGAVNCWLFRYMCIGLYIKLCCVQNFSKLSRFCFMSSSPFQLGKFFLPLIFLKMLWLPVLCQFCFVQTLVNFIVFTTNTPFNGLWFNILQE